MRQSARLDIKMRCVRLMWRRNCFPAMLMSAMMISLPVRTKNNVPGQIKMFHAGEHPRILFLEKTNFPIASKKYP